jgi:phosphoglycolate phosphatase
MPGFPIYLLDFDGTLAATRPAGLACLTRTFAERDVSVSSGVVESVIGSGVPLEAAIAMLVPGLTTNDVADCTTRYRELYPDIDAAMTSLFEGVRETMSALHHDGRKIVVVSNKGRVALEAALARFDLLDMTSAILAADPGLPVKPDPQAFHRRVRPLFEDASLADFIMVGDTAADIGFAQAAGIASCWVSYGYGDADRCLSMKPDFVADALSDLLPSGAEVRIA